MLTAFGCFDDIVLVPFVIANNITYLAVTLRLLDIQGIRREDIEEFVDRLMQLIHVRTIGKAEIERTILVFVVVKLFHQNAFRVQ